jgi:drug/metabolite transporter (DMT)-like permease
MSDLQLSIGVLLGMAGGLGNILLVVAFSLGSVSRLGVLDYTAYIWALVFGYLLFAEQPHSWALVGTCLVVYAGYRVTFDRQ